MIIIQEVYTFYFALLKKEIDSKNSGVSSSPNSNCASIVIALSNARYWHLNLLGNKSP